MKNDRLVCRLLQDLGNAYRDCTVFQVYDGNALSDISGGRFAEDVLLAAAYFSGNQITGRHIALVGTNSYQWVVVFFAILASGNVVVPMNPDLPEELFQNQCRDADIGLLCCADSETADKLRDIPVLFFDAIRAERPLAPEEITPLSPDETALMMFTSGTTGKSKTVMLSTNNLFASAGHMVTLLRKRTELTGAREKYFLSLPMYHIGSIRNMLVQLLQGAETAIGRGAKYIFMDMPRLNPTRVDMVPAMAESFAKILRRTPAEKRVNYIGHNLKGILAVGAAMKPAVSRYIMEQGIQIEVIFGMTESAGDGCMCEMDPEHVSSIGKPLGDVSLRIQEGELQIRSEGVMKGYYKDPDVTAQVIVDGWLHTGDMAYCDADGYYYINGRKKNVIILSNGENVNPEEIEAALGACEAIAECLVYSDGKGICADVFADDRDAAAAYIRAYNEKMPMYRQVYKVIYTEDPLPKTGSGKLKRKENI